MTDVDRRLSVLEDILGVSSMSPCSGEWETCEGPCESEQCAMSNNRLRDLERLVNALVSEFRWHRAWAEEMESLGLVPSGTMHKVNLRVRRALLEELLSDTQEQIRQVQGLPHIEDKVRARISEIRTQIDDIDQMLQRDKT